MLHRVQEALDLEALNPTPMSSRPPPSDLDLYNHMTTGQYGTYYVDHRMEGLRDHMGGT